jgi:hypothetical protein
MRTVFSRLRRVTQEHFNAVLGAQFATLDFCGVFVQSADGNHARNYTLWWRPVDPYPRPNSRAAHAHLADPVAEKTRSSVAGTSAALACRMAACLALSAATSACRRSKVF